jgi:hypothetical protein
VEKSRVTMGRLIVLNFREMGKSAPPFSWKVQERKALQASARRVASQLSLEPILLNFELALVKSRQGLRTEVLA